MGGVGGVFPVHLINFNKKSVSPMYHQQHANRKIKTKLEISRDKIMDTPI